MRIVIDNLHCKNYFSAQDHTHGVDFTTELREYMKVRANGYQFSPLFKQGKWDGYSHFYTKTGKYATGFLSMVYVKIKELAPDIEITIEDRRTNVPVFREELTDVLPNTTDRLRDYQMEGIRAIVENTIQIGDTPLPFQRGIYDSATNSGKSTVMAGLAANMVNPSLLILIDRVAIFKDLVKSFRALFGPLVGQIGGGVEQFAPITICMAQTLKGKLGSINTLAELAKFDMVIVDEGHKAANDTYKDILSHVKAASRLIMSGSPLDMDNKATKMTLVGMFGKPLVKVTNKQMIAAGVSQRPTVHIHLVDDPTIKAAYAWADEAAAFHQSPVLAAKLTELAADGEQTLATYAIISHGERLQRAVPGSILTHGKDPDRDRALSDFVDSKTNCLIASMILKEGVNIPNIRRLVRCEGGKSDITTKQVVGRALRNDGVHSTVEVHDFYIKGKSSEKHSRLRLSAYEREGFEIVYHYAHKKGRPL
jgi:superfamily II DNA or RNA helicase